MKLPSEAWTVSGLISEGSRPALWASNRSPPYCLKKASAIWLRAELAVQGRITRRFSNVLTP